MLHLKITLTSPICSSAAVGLAHRCLPRQGFWAIGAGGGGIFLRS
jgi:hypothetical protein